MKSCKLCEKPALDVLLDFGPQALTNRFLRSAGEPQYLHPLDIGVCAACGVVQLGSLAPVDEIRPRFDWLSYNEPERHLDDVAALLSKLPGLTPQSSILGLTYKDESTLGRLQKLGFSRCRLADRREDLGISHPLGAIESVQRNLTAHAAEWLTAKYGRADVVILRHVLEHAHDIRTLLDCLSRLAKPGGYVVLEVPDAVRALDRCDYSTVWEEHAFYFTAATLRQCLTLAGFEVVSLESHFYTLENSLVAVVRTSSQPRQTSLTPAEVKVETGRLHRFADQFDTVRAERAAVLERVAESGKQTALLGAGHLSAAYINLLGLEQLVNFVVDDASYKQGLFMPGSRLPILPSAQLVERGVGLCLMTVRPEIEDAVARKNEAFTARGGRLSSIFPDSPYAAKAA